MKPRPLQQLKEDNGGKAPRKGSIKKDQSLEVLPLPCSSVVKSHRRTRKEDIFSWTRGKLCVDQ